MKILCFDVGCTDIKYGVCENGEILFKKKTPTAVEAGLENFKQTLSKIVNDITSVMDIKVVGVSCAGSVDIYQSKIVVCPDNAPWLDNFDFKSFFKEKHNLECYADNDVNCFGIAEMIAGNGKKYDHFLMMTVGTGIGGAIIMQKQLWRGPNFNAGEFGRMSLYGEEKFESLAATSALVRSAKAHGLIVNDGQDVFTLYDNHDPVAVKVVEKFYQDLALGISNLVYAFNPQSIIIGGGITNREPFIEELDKVLKQELHHSFYETVVIQRSHFKNDGGMLGAYYLVMQSLKEKENGC
ncbi:MAG: ROK family protein [Bacilli bacterium]|nr:ROK family protein [Bacilli bacterium]